MPIMSRIHVRPYPFNLLEWDRHFWKKAQAGKLQ